MRPAGCPLHLLLLHHALADHLVDRGFNERERQKVGGPVDERLGSLEAEPLAESSV